MIGKVFFNRAPLTQNRFAELPLGAVTPEGWLKEQLDAAAKGLTGQLYKFWPDVKDSAWRGGEGDGWERAPYYLDGLIPLAWLTGNEELKAVAREYIEWTLASQKEDGSFGPEKNDDWWPRMVMLKALWQYYTATGDKRVPEMMLRYFAYEYRSLPGRPLRDWACARGAENMLTVAALYNLTGKSFLLKLLALLRDQTCDWTAYFDTFAYRQSLAKALPWQELVKGMEGEEGGLVWQDRKYYRREYHLTHVVNTAMGLKFPGVVHMIKSGVKENEGFETGYKNLMRYHGVASGIFTGDEHISGASPRQGTETCAVAELMYTCEALMTTGSSEKLLGDVLEKMAFNALPAAQSGDNLTHQYDQQANQVKCTVEKRSWYNNNDDSNTFGLEPNFGCCTANLHQGWPKYVSHLWYAAQDEGFLCLSYAPCRMRFLSGDVPVSIRVETAYPFGETVRVRVEAGRKKKFPLWFRVPEWAEGAVAQVDGEEYDLTAGDLWKLEREWDGNDLTFVFPMKPRITRWHRQSAAVEVGPLVMAFHPAEKWEKIKDHPFVPDWQVTTEDAWNWAIVPETARVEFDPDAAGAFKDGRYPVRAYVMAAPVAEWGMKGGSADDPPVSPAVSKDALREIELVPYGDTSLRITQFPVARVE